MYYEDFDFGLRTRMQGHTILSVPRARCYHGPGTEGLALRSIGVYRSLRVYQTLADRWQVVLKNYQLRSLLLLAPILVTFELMTIFGVVSKGWMTPWLRAVRSTMGQLPKILSKRRVVQASRRVPDREILEGGPIPFASQMATSPVERAGRALLEGMSSTYWHLVERWL